MIYQANKGQVSYGEAIGILMLDTYCPFIPGDVGNASSYAFPVRFETVKGLTVERIMKKDKSAYGNLLEAAGKLAGQGVRAITGDCGFMALFQQELTEEFDLPVFLSSLLQVPFISTIIGRGKVGIISANGESINDPALLEKAGINNSIPIEIRGLEDKPNFHKSVFKETGYLDSDKIEKEVVETALEMVEAEPNIKAILLECSMLPPYGAAVQEAVGLPIFDYLSMINYVYSAVVKKRFKGFM